MSEKDDFNEELASEMSDGSWRQERKFVLSQLAKHERSIHGLRRLMNAMDLDFLRQIHAFDLKLTRLTVCQTIVIAVVVFAIKWLFKV